MTLSRCRTVGALVAATAVLVGCAKDPDDNPDGGRPPVNNDGGNTSCAGDGEAAQPFGNHGQAYTSGALRPSGSPDDIDEAVRVAYDRWKQRYVDSGCGAGRYYVATGMGESMTVSEAHGYGMLITAFMAGHDPQARTVFDGMYHYFRDHPTDSSDDLMSWSQSSDCENNKGADSASDGDLDIAYALLLADRQWGSNGAIDYHGEALRVIAAIRQGEVDSSGRYVLLGNWASPGSRQYNATRSSDFMPGHLRSFAAATGNADWTELATETYDLVATLQEDEAPTTGLLPDFIVSPTGTPRPAEPGFLENDTDGDYAYNACRDPWRLGVDFLVGGDTRARDAVRKMDTWIRGKTGGDPEQIVAGYTLEGAELRDYTDLAFVAPFGVAATIGGNQQWVDAIWQMLASADEQGYYGDTLKVLAMITMSGNWWAPEAAPCGGS